MNWEVQTMPSKTSFCNGTEFRKCLSRWWPLWVIYGVILFIMLPGVLLNARTTTTPYVSTEQIGYLSNVILSETQMLLPLTAFCAGLLAAAAMFGYLYTPRSAGLAASLPIRRGCMFRTHLLAGLVMLLSAEAVIFGLAVLIEATRFELVIEPLLIWLGILALETVVFYGIAVLCAMFTGHVVMLPCLYLLVNFIAVGFQLLVEAVLYMFVYGMSGMVDLPVDWLSPLVLFMRRTSINNDYLLRPISGTGTEAAVNSFSGWTYPLVWAAFALLLLVCAGQLYRRRRMESAGDTVAIPALKPVLKYIVALFAGLAMPVGVYGMLLNVPAYRTQLAPFLLLTVLGAALGFVISEMVIRKSLRIPRTVWRGCAVTAAVCCLVVVGAKCDLSGYARRIPDTAQVKSARIICNGYNSALTEAENIQAVEDIHRAVVAEREKITDDTGITSLQLTYKLTNGKVLMREYTLPDTSTRLAQIEQVLNCDEARTTRNTPALPMTLEHLTYASIGYETESGDYLYVELTAEQALDLYENAIVPDCADGTMGRAWLTDSGTRQSTAYAVTIGYQLSQYDPATGETTYANVDYTPLTDSTRTLAWLRAHDIKPLLECDSIKYGGEPDTQPAINTYETADSSFGR